MMSKWQWRPQNIGDARFTECLPRRAASTKQRGPKPKTKAACALGGKDGRGRLPDPLGTQLIMSQAADGGQRAVGFHVCPVGV